MSPPKVDLRLHRQQMLALQSPANENLYGGAAGGGKSHLMRAAAVIYCTAIPGLQAYLFRRFFPDLVKNHMEGPQSFHVLLAPLVASGHCEIVRTEVRFWNGSRIFLNHLNHEKDLGRYQGQEIHLLLMDELTHFTEAMYRYLRGRLRLGALRIPEPHSKKFPRVIAGTNPGSVGHVWVKRTFVNNGPYAVVRGTQADGGMTRTFIPAKVADNPTMTENDPDYVARLRGLGDPVLVRAMLDGDWNIVAGAVFGYVWRQERHTCDPFPIPDHWKIWRGGDDGFAAPASIHWLAEDPTTGTIYVVDELYRAGMLPEPMAERIKARDARIPLTSGGGTIYRNESSILIRGTMDAAAFADTGAGDQTVPRGKKLNALGCRFTPCEKWPGSRVDRVKLMHEYLAPNPRCPKRLPKLRFFRHCAAAIETIPALPRCPHDPEDVDTDAEDHAFDSVTYGLQARRPRSRGTVRIGGV